MPSTIWSRVREATTRFAIPRRHGSRTPGRSTGLGLFLLVFVTYFVYLRLFGDRTFWYDSGHYFACVSSFSLDRYHVALRGYSFPYICWSLRQLAEWRNADPVVVFWVFSSMVFAWLGTVVVPRLAKFAFYRASTSVRSVLLFNALVFFFFRGNASYPLTDFPAVAALLTAIWLVVTSYRAFFVGLTCALAMNFRPVYAIAALPLGLLVIHRLVLAWRNRSWLFAVGYGCAFAIGLAVVLGPQAYINRHNFGRLSFMPPTDLAFGRSLYSEQIQGGLRIQKYETNVGPDLPRASVSFADPSGAALVAEHPVSADRDILRLILDKPFKFVAIYTRHLFNGLDVKYPSTYIQHFAATSWLFSLLNYAVIFVFLEAISGSWHIGADWLPRIGVLATVLAPIAAVIPSAVEVRFFLPLHLLMYSVVAFRRYSWPLRVTPGQLVRFAAFVALCFAMSDSAYACIR
jgi:hypothetical protein